MSESAKHYWEKRLRENFDLKGVGYYKAGRSYNYWIYKMRKKIFLRHLNKMLLEKPDPDILEIGPGSGFYTDMLLNKGVKKLWLCDLTEISANNLAIKFPTAHIYTNDIGSPLFSLPRKKFDIILCMDVLFHVTSDAAYWQSFKNIKNHLQDDGFLIFTENFSPFYQNRGHIADRTASQILTIAEAFELKIIYSKPMFYFLNPPVNQTNKLLWLLSKFRVSVLAFFEKMGLGFLNHLPGFFLYTIDSMLHFMRLRGFGTSIVICKTTKGNIKNT